MMIVEDFYVNVGRLMGILPRPTPKNECTLCTLEHDRAETIQELGIISISGIDGDYHDNNTEGIYQ